MKNIIKERYQNKILTLCVPLIGCGLDKLDWNDVKYLLYKTFNDMNIQINVYYL